MSQLPTKRTVSVVSLLVAVLLLTSCVSGYGPPVDQARLEEAHTNAADALELARALNAPDYARDQYGRAESQFNETFERLKQSPSSDLVGEYRDVVRWAREASLIAAREQVDELEELRKQRDRYQSNLRAKAKLRKARKKSANKSDTIAQLKTRLSRMRSSLQDQSELRQRIHQLEQQLSEARARRSREAVMVRFDTVPLFAAGSARFTPEGQRMVDSIVPQLKKYDDRTIQVRGHTDPLPVREGADFQSNWELSAQRAINVAKYLVYARDIDKERVRAVGMAGYHPRAPSGTESQRERNRRVEIFLMPPDSQTAIIDEQALSSPHQ